MQIAFLFKKRLRRLYVDYLEGDIMPLTLSDACLNIAPSVTLKINALVIEMRKRGEDVIGLGAGEPDFDTPLFIREKAKEAIDKGYTKYTAASGIPQLKKAIADTYLRDKNLHYDVSQVIVGTGAKQVLLGALQAIINKGDEVLLPCPCWVSYPEMVQMAGGTPVRVETDVQNGFVPTKEQLESKITKNTKAMIINSPSNPTGAVYTKEQLQMVADLAVKHGFYIISDEIYEKLVYENAEHVSIATLGEAIKEQTIVVNGFSKSYAMTGWRLGYALGPQRVIALMSAYQSHATGNTNSIAQYAGLAALQGDQSCVDTMKVAFDRRRLLMLSLIKELPNVSCFAPKGAFYIMLDVHQLYGQTIHSKCIKDSMSFAQILLEEAQVAVVPGADFGAPNFCRLSYAVSDGKILQAMERIGTFLRKLSVNEMGA